MIDIILIVFLIAAAPFILLVSFLSVVAMVLAFNLFFDREEKTKLKKF